MAGSFKDKITGAVDKYGDQINKGLDKAKDTIDQKTGGKYSDKLDQAVGKAKDSLDGLDGRKDDLPGGQGRSNIPEGTTPDQAAGGDATRRPQQHDPRE